MSIQAQPPIFLVGCPRSGTTFLQSAIAAHPTIHSFPETQFFKHLTPHNPLKAQLGLVARSKIRPKLISFFQEINRPDLISTIPQIPYKPIYINYFINLLQSLTHEQGKDRFLEKTPEHLYYIPEIEPYVPGVKFIHLFRNGTDVVASLYEVTHRYPQRWWGVWTLDYCIDRWLEMVALSQTYLDQPHHCAVRYETLLQNFSECLQRICQFLNIEYSEAMIDNYHHSSKFLINTTSRQVENQIRDISTVSSKFESLFDESQREYIIERVSAVDLETIPFL
ncbi:sulfotransferase family protein [Roseofilum capinflatum]|uniref:Sulfotransferase n=1 Tax=Roseofilum capinflatum BLCC-M114 TaxID=3022440 RepID=A0ABT7B776_9CYAN|nr:sulfotransferase [Roseofilum capinflatum]MDJ1174986.1 sulfotransferase [Roseofilum capinflatum BLCC-M114]